MSVVDDMLGNSGGAAGGGTSIVDQMLAGDPALQAAAAQPDAPFVTRAGRAWMDVPRQIGLTARDALEGIANAAQVVTEPIRYFTDRALGLTGKTAPLGVLASRAADAIGLPTPQNATERVVNEGAKLGFGALLPGLGAAAAPAAPIADASAPLIGRAVTALAQNPTQTVSSAVGAGMAGQSVKEAGGSPLAQAGAALAGGVAGGMAPGAISSAVDGAGSVLDSMRRAMTPGAAASAVDQSFGAAVQRAGINLGALAPAARIQLRRDYAAALNTGGQVSDEALQRLAALRSAGVTPTQGMVSLDPVQVTTEQNLAKMGANQKDGALQGLARLQNQNNGALIGSLNSLGASADTLPITAGRSVLGGVVSRNSALETAEQAAWDAAKAHPGYTAPIYPDGLNAAIGDLGSQGMTGYLPKQISDYMSAFQTGQQPFTAQAYRNLQSMLSGAMAEGGNTAAAAGIARNALNRTPISPIPAGGHLDFGGNSLATPQMAAAMQAHDAQAQQAIDLVNQARAATAAKYAYQNSSPLVRTALSDSRTADPENLAKSFVLGGTVADAQAVADAVGPQGVGGIRDALASYIKRQALSGAPDETGKVSAKALKQTLDNIGDEKLGMFFSPEEVAQLRNVSRAASLSLAQPAGSAVNNSNSGAMLAGKALDFLDSKVLRYLPGSEYTPGIVTAPLRNVVQGVGARGALNVTPGLLQTAPGAAAATPKPGLLLPATVGASLYGSGLLAAPN